MGSMIEGSSFSGFTLCRLLIRAGHNPSARLEAYRGSTLCLRVCSIGEGARLTVKEPNGGRAHFAKRTAFPSSPVASRAQEKELRGHGSPPQEERRGVRHRRARRVPAPRFPFVSIRAA